MNIVYISWHNTPTKKEREKLFFLPHRLPLSPLHSMFNVCFIPFNSEWKHQVLAKYTTTKSTEYLSVIAKFLRIFLFCLLQFLTVMQITFFHLFTTINVLRDCRMFTTYNFFYKYLLLARAKNVTFIQLNKSDFGLCTVSICLRRSLWIFLKSKEYFYLFWFYIFVWLTNNNKKHEIRYFFIFKIWFCWK